MSSAAAFCAERTGGPGHVPDKSLERSWALGEACGWLPGRDQSTKIVEWAVDP